MIFNDEGTWPDGVVRYLETNRALFWMCEVRRHSDAESLSNDEARKRAHEYDVAVGGLREVLQPYTLHGYHCTRLTEPEITDIRANGMRPPNRAFLCQRIEQLKQTGAIDEETANELKEKNQAHEGNRAGMIWFCFFPPRIAGRGGIQRLFRSWGGEALYNSHERHPRTGPVLARIGVPCIIEADVPIASVPRHTFPDVHLYRQFLINRGFETSEPCYYEGYATEPIPAENIRRIIRLSDPDLAILTDCDQWRPPLR